MSGRSVKPFSYSTGQPVQVPQSGRVPKKIWEEDTSDLRVTVKPEANQLTLTLR